MRHMSCNKEEGRVLSCDPFIISIDIERGKASNSQKF